MLFFGFQEEEVPIEEGDEEEEEEEEEEDSSEEDDEEIADAEEVSAVLCKVVLQEDVRMWPFQIGSVLVHHFRRMNPMSRRRRKLRRR